MRCRRGTHNSFFTGTPAVETVATLGEVVVVVISEDGVVVVAATVMDDGEVVALAVCASLMLATELALAKTELPYMLMQ